MLSIVRYNDCNSKRKQINMKFSDEQTEVIECPDRNLTVNAFAGSGKTSTLVGYASARPEERILYLAFNASVAGEARNRFPRNVECRTSHSLAYASFGAMYKHKLGNPRARDAVDFLSSVMRPTDMGRDKYFFAQCALRRVSSFFGTGSTDDFIPDDPGDAGVASPGGEVLDASKVTRAAQHLWDAMKDTSNQSVMLPHDGYLKLFQLSRPDLSRYDRILLDEAQDTNPCLLNIIKGQGCGKVLVGDKHQNIYGFRQSINAMDLVEGSRLDLTSSFRFGDRVANVANAILGTFSGERIKIRGLSTDRSGIQSRCYLHRTNAGLFDRGVEMVNSGRLPHFVGGVRNYSFETIADTWKLSVGQNDIRDPFIRRFESYAALESYAESVDDREIKSRMKIVSNYGSSIPQYVDRLVRADTPVDRAHATLTTAHKAKGQEWDEVTLGDDFPEMMLGTVPRTAANAKAFKEKGLSVEEVNLAYVAATRAKKELRESDSMADFLRWAGVNSADA